ncbi:MAG: T9SS type A sorting domain-containing protein [Candidatus Marinimicrobia bacterium]|nr:T9SS type A sorting domain-containing protein [Candidatus Neomarinimicrobiota bacterium]
MKQNTIYAFIILSFLLLNLPPLNGQDAFTGLKDKYYDGILTEAEYSQKLKNLYLTLIDGNYRAEPGEHPIKCLFGVRIEVISYMSQVEKSALAAVEHRPVTQAFYVTPEGHFKIHYDTTGVHAVQVERLLGESVPDWIYYTGKAYERSWSLLTDSLGYISPPVDSVDGNEVDVYIQDLAPGEYGEVFWEPNKTSYIVMDNDFAEGAYFTHGLDAMRVTAAHEFFHVVQLGYALQSGSNLWYYELASTWFEDVAYDEVNDYVQWIESYYSRANSSLYRTNGYQAAIFGKFLEENYSAAVMRMAWEQIAEYSPEVALDNVLKSSGEEVDGMKAAFGKFALWNWFTGSRSRAGVFFEEAGLYPEFTAATNTTLSDSAIIAPLIGLNQIAFRIHRFEPTRSSAMKAHLTPLGESNVWGSTMTGSPPQIISLPPGISTLVASVNTGTGLIIAAANGSVKSSEVASEKYSLEVTVTGLPPSKIIAQYPNPFNSETKIDFDLGAATQSMVFTVFDILGRRVYREPLGDLPEGENSVRFTPDVQLSTGLYLYRIAGTGVEINGKFTLVR